MGATLVLMVVLVACGPAVVDPTPTPAPELPQGVAAAREMLSETEDVPLDQVEVVSYESREWRDGCLELAEEGEMCIQVITPGYRVVLQVEDARFVARTDEPGNVIRFEE